jgi:hypothetical protein
MVPPRSTYSTRGWPQRATSAFVSGLEAGMSASLGRARNCCAGGTVTFFIQTFFIHNKVYTNFLYTGQILHGTKFVQDKFYTGTKFIRGQSLYGDKVYTGQSLYICILLERTGLLQIAAPKKKLHCPPSGLSLAL